MRPFRVGVLLCLCTAAGFSQDFPKAEIFGGYSYANMPVFSGRANTNGWNASATVNLYKWFGLTSDFNGLYGLKGSETLQLGGSTITEQISENFHSFLFGPQISYRKGRLVPFAHLLVGESRVGEKLSVSSFSGGFIAGPSISQRATTTGTAAMGLGIDYGFGKNLAWRVQVDSLLTAGSASNVRVSTGIVFRIKK